MEGREQSLVSISDPPRGTRPILIQEASDFEVKEVWRYLCGPEDSAWKREIGLLGRGKGSFQEVAEAWANALVGQLADPGCQVEASRILARVCSHAEEVESNRRVYAPRNSEEESHTVWPNRSNGRIFSMNLCRKPDRFITKRTKIASAGSCFAMNLGGVLREWGFNYFITEKAPVHLSPEQAKAKHYNYFSARYGIIFNAPSLRQLVERAFGLWKPRPYLYQYRGGGAENGLWFDPYRESVHFESPEEYAESLPTFEEALRRTAEEAEVFVMTLGLHEVWYFRNDGSYLSRVPWKLAPALLGRRVLSVEDNVAELERLHSVWTRCNPNIRFLVTVSPVPLMKTFRSAEMNVVVANCHSKATLRCAAVEFAHRHDNVTYFPAYEAVMYGSPNPFEEDGRHVTEEAVGRVMRMFRENFCRD